MTEDLGLTGYSEYGEEGKKYKVFNLGRGIDKMRFHMNLKTQNLDEYSYVIQTASDLTDDGVILFPYLEALAKRDTETIMDVLSRYLRPLLGENEGEARETYEWLKTRIGLLSDTTWGDELAHIFSGIGLMFDTGATMRIIITGNNLYQGFCLVGGGYSLLQYETMYEPVMNTRFAEVFNLASPHTSSFNKILDLIQFADDIERQAQKTACTTVSRLAALIRQHGISTNNEDVIRREARNLSFPTDQNLPATAHNVGRVLRAMSANESEEFFPLHPSMILEKDRRKRLLSAFGAVAPSFMIPGGRSVSLDGSFTYNVVVKGKKEQKSTTRMFCQMVPLAKAAHDLDLLIQNHNVLTPIGTPLAGRASSFSLIREFAGEGGVNVLAALRSLCGVALIDEVAASVKRGREDEPGDSAGQKKRARAGF